MAYKFQIGNAILSGSLTSKEGFNAGDDGLADAGVIAGATSIDGSGDLTMGTITMTGFSVDADGDTALKSLKIDDDSTIGTASDSDMILLDPDADITIANDLDFIIGKVSGLKLADGAVTSTAAELNLLDAAVENTVVNSKAVIYGSAGQVKIGSLLVGSDTAIDSSGNFAGNNASFVEITGSGDLFLDGSTLRIPDVADVALDAADSILLYDATDDKMKKISFPSYASAIAGSGISGSAAGLLSVDIDELTALSDASLHQTQDHFMFSDNGTEKKVTFSNLEDSIFANVSGDATIAAGGALTLAANSVSQLQLDDDAVGADELASNAVVNASIASNAAIDMDKLDGGSLASSLSDLAQGDLMYAGDVDDSSNIKSITFSDLEDAIFGNVSGDATIAAGGALTLAANSVSQLQLDDDAVGADELAANAVVNASVASGAAIVATKLDFNVDLGGDITFGNQSDDTISTTGHLTVGGDLTVNGSVTSVNSTTINITSSFTFEGPADDFETTLHSGTPTQDITVYLPQYSASAGAHSAYLPVLAGAPTAASALVTAAEFALLDGASSIGTTAVADGHGIFMNQGGTMAHTTVQTLAAYLDDEITAMPNLVTTAATTVGALGAGSIAAGFTKINLANILDLASIDIDGGTDIGADLVSADLIIVDDGAGGTNRKATIGRVAKYVGDNLALNINPSDDGETFEVGFNYWNATLGGAESGTLPASPSAGQVVYIKAPSNCSTTNTITINKAGSQTIDGETAIILESPNAAVSLMYVAANLWKIF